MTNSEMQKLMAGSTVDKMNLFNYFMDKLVSGQGLQDHEIPMLEFLKNDLIEIKGPIIANMSASMVGRGGVVG
jgi:hypothetical protein